LVIVVVIYHCLVNFTAPLEICSSGNNRLNAAEISHGYNADNPLQRGKKSELITFVFQKRTCNTHTFSTSFTHLTEQIEQHNLPNLKDRLYDGDDWDLYYRSSQFPCSDNDIR